MKLKYLGLLIMAVLMSVSCTKQGKKAEIKVDDRGIPVEVSDILMGDTCSIDTLYADDENVYMLIDNADYRQKVIFDRYGLIVNNPLLTLDSLTASSYRIGDLISSTVVDFAIEENVEALRGLFPVYDDFKTVTYTKTQTKPTVTLFAMSVSDPDNSVKNAAGIRSWIASAIDTVDFTGSFRALGEYEAGKFAEMVDGVEMSFPLYDTYSSLIYRKTDNFVTYLDYYTTFTGGAHGMYAISFPTYLTQLNRALTCDYMFKADAANDIRSLIYEALLGYPDFTSNHNINSVSQVKAYIDSNLYGEALPIPDPGLLANGVVFCYQPYEIASYADGSFQLVVPYEKLKPYMTEAGKSLIP